MSAYHWAVLSLNTSLYFPQHLRLHLCRPKCRMVVVYRAPRYSLSARIFLGLLGGMNVLVFPDCSCSSSQVGIYRKWKQIKTPLKPRELTIGSSLEFPGYGLLPTSYLLGHCSKIFSISSTFPSSKFLFMRISIQTCCFSPFGNKLLTSLYHT